MTHLLDTIKIDQLQARKEKNTLRAQVLTTLFSEAQMIGKNAQRITTDSEVQAVIKKFIKNIDETCAVLQKDAATHAQRIATLTEEKAILMHYLPAQMSEQALQECLKKIIDEGSLQGPKALGTLLKELKTRHDGSYSAQQASVIAKALLGT